MDQASESARRLRKYLDMVGEELGNERRKGSFAAYALGLLSDEDRKTAEAIAVRDCATAEDADAAHQRLHHFRIRPTNRVRVITPSEPVFSRPFRASLCGTDCRRGVVGHPCARGSWPLRPGIVRGRGARAA